MITNKLISNIRDLAYEEYKKYGVPTLFQVDYVNEIGNKLASKYKVDRNIVLLGTILMDVKLGQAYTEGKLVEHIAMSEQYAKSLLKADADLTNSESENILACIRQHHGAKKFASLEAEVVCNADCYKFVSVKGVIGGLRTTRDMPLQNLVSLFLNKAKEKWSALSLSDCKKQLKDEYKVIVNLLNNFKD